MRGIYESLVVIGLFSKFSKAGFWFAAVCLAVSILYQSISIFHHVQVTNAMANNTLSWIDFKVSRSAMDRALQLDMESHNTENPLNWIDLLAYLGAKYGGNFKQYRAKDLNDLVNQCKDGVTVAQLAQNIKYFDYYKNAYEAVLGGMVGEYLIQLTDATGGKAVQLETGYGLKSYAPVAEGFGFSHYYDFGKSRSFGFSRPHQGHDIFGRIGTPVVAVESGIVETLGWNQYGGWRIGIRSLDGRRYYYYAHLRKDRPYQKDMQEGMLVQAGDVIGYLGMTGYSNAENVNGMKSPHLHFGMEIIPEGCERESNCEIWIDTYEIIKFLEQHKSTVVLDKQTKEYNRKYRFLDVGMLGLSAG